MSGKKDKKSKAEAIGSEKEKKASKAAGKPKAGVSVVDIKESEEYKELEDKYLRLAAEFENFKKRSAREFSRLIETASDDLMLELLEVIDDFQRALQLEHSNIKAFQKGTELIYNKLGEILRRRNLKEIKAVGEAFDPMYHEAVMQKEVEDKEDGIIIEELQKGYLVNDRVLRPSRVVVAKRKLPEPDESNNNDVSEN
ncbi:MAG: nucleotide exchange factor GrpE [candidate division Zixibacteria bacterium 4484_95]|nr:MAG: nucleotide exchange factor GrpE [candidate division Zixibacteria bacterium 4484_95]